MRVIALESFTTPSLSMIRGKEGNITSDVLLRDLLNAGYVKLIDGQQDTPEQTGDDESKQPEDPDAIAQNGDAATPETVDGQQDTPEQTGDDEKQADPDDQKVAPVQPKKGKKNEAK